MPQPFSASASDALAGWEMLHVVVQRIERGCADHLVCRPVAKQGKKPLILSQFKTSSTHCDDDPVSKRGPLVQFQLPPQEGSVTGVYRGNREGTQSGAFWQRLVDLARHGRRALEWTTASFQESIQVFWWKSFHLPTTPKRSLLQAVPTTTSNFHRRLMRGLYDGPW
jgi:hypothetical protein